MKKYVWAMALASMVIALSACEKTGGEGPTVTKNYSLQGFTAVDNGIDADVYLAQGADFKVEIQAQQNILDLIETPVTHGKLKLQYKPGGSIGWHSPVTVHITMPVITGLAISGSGEMQVPQGLNATALDLSISGSGDMTLAALHASDVSATISGSGNITVSGDSLATETDLISGSGNLDLRNISAGKVSAAISGSGNASVYAVHTLDASISGSGDIIYGGTPQVSSRISGSGSLKHF